MPSLILKTLQTTLPLRVFAVLSLAVAFGSPCAAAWPDNGDEITAPRRIGYNKRNVLNGCK